MFDDLSKKGEGEVKAQPIIAPTPGAAPVSGKMAEDIFADTDNSSEHMPMPQAPRPPMGPVGQMPVGSDYNDNRQNVIKKAIIAIFGLLLLGGIGYGGYWIYGNFFAADDTNQQNADNGAATGDDQQAVNLNEAENGTNTENGTAEESEIPYEEPQVATEVPKLTAMDSDQDGLTDDEEAGFGSDPMNIDSDGDGLFDREEVKVYKTDPVKADTDGDGYSDGDEVKGGYNPLGEGKLYEASR